MEYINNNGVIPLHVIFPGLLCNNLTIKQINIPVHVHPLSTFKALSTILEGKDLTQTVAAATAARFPCYWGEWEIPLVLVTPSNNLFTYYWYLNLYFFDFFYCQNCLETKLILTKMLHNILLDYSCGLNISSHQSQLKTQFCPKIYFLWFHFTFNFNKYQTLPSW